MKSILQFFKSLKSPTKDISKVSVGSEEKSDFNTKSCSSTIRKNLYPDMDTCFDQCEEISYDSFTAASISLINNCASDNSNKLPVLQIESNKLKITEKIMTLSSEKEKKKKKGNTELKQQLLSFKTDLTNCTIKQKSTLFESDLIVFQNGDNLFCDIMHESDRIDYNIEKKDDSITFVEDKASMNVNHDCLITSSILKKKKKVNKKNGHPRYTGSMVKRSDSKQLAFKNDSIVIVDDTNSSDSKYCHDKESESIQQKSSSLKMNPIVVMNRIHANQIKYKTSTIDNESASVNCSADSLPVNKRTSNLLVKKKRTGARKATSQSVECHDVVVNLSEEKNEELIDPSSNVSESMQTCLSSLETERAILTQNPLGDPELVVELDNVAAEDESFSLKQSDKRRSLRISSKRRHLDDKDSINAFSKKRSLESDVLQPFSKKMKVCDTNPTEDCDNANISFPTSNINAKSSHLVKTNTTESSSESQIKKSNLSPYSKNKSSVTKSASLHNKHSSSKNDLFSAAKSKKPLKIASIFDPTTWKQKSKKVDHVVNSVVVIDDDNSSDQDNPTPLKISDDTLAFLRSGLPPKMVASQAAVVEHLPAPCPLVSHTRGWSISDIDWLSYQFNIATTEDGFHERDEFSINSSFHFLSGRVPLHLFSAAPELEDDFVKPPELTIRRLDCCTDTDAQLLAEMPSFLGDSLIKAMKQSRLWSAQDSKDALQQSSWVDRYAPRSIEGLLGNKSSLSVLHRWLQNWEAPNVNWQASDDEEIDACSNSVLLCGPSGCGKTAAVYALASELDFQVFEVSVSERRAGRQLLARLQEATQSQQVVRGVASSECENEAILALTNRSLVLIDDIDLVMEEDRGLWPAVLSFMEQSKRPVFLTATDSSVLTKMACSTDRIQVVALCRPSRIQLAALLNTVCFLEGVHLGQEQAERVAEYFRGDGRAALNYLQVMCTSGDRWMPYGTVPPQKQAPEDLSHLLFRLRSNSREVPTQSATLDNNTCDDIFSTDAEPLESVQMDCLSVQERVSVAKEAQSNSGLTLVCRHGKVRSLLDLYHHQHRPHMNSLLQDTCIDEFSDEVFHAADPIMGHLRCWLWQRHLLWLSSCVIDLLQPEMSELEKRRDDSVDTLHNVLDIKLASAHVDVVSNLPHATRLNKRAHADYLWSLREICTLESTRQAEKSGGRRRFTHRLDSVGLRLTPSTKMLLSRGLFRLMQEDVGLESVLD